MAFPKRILMRACCDPTVNYSTFEVIKNDHIWNNSGNMIFPYSIYRTLACEGVEITTYRNITQKDADFINENYDMFVIPLANAFRANHIKALGNLTNLIKKLNIPCVVIGVGMQAGANPDPNASYPFDEATKDFCSAVLARSKSIGVRGDFTKQYLLHLGFKDEEIDVIGCPSMYLHGREMQITKKKEHLDENSVLCMNGHANIPPQVLALFENVRNTHKGEHYFIGQELRDMKLLYAGVSFDNAPANYPRRATDDIYLGGHYRIFGTVPSWIDFLKKADFSFGCRIHGNITATLAGTPSMIFAGDSRTQELAEYHGLPYILASEVTPDMSLSALYDSLDYTKFNATHAKNFDHYIDFLDYNNIDHIYNHGGENYFDKKIAETVFDEGTKPLFSVSPKEAAERICLYSQYTAGIEKGLREKIDNLNKTSAASATASETEELKKTIPRLRIKLKDAEEKYAEYEKTSKEEIEELTKKVRRLRIKLKDAEEKLGLR